MRRSLVYIIFTIVISQLGHSQQLPLFTQSNFNNFGINPAFAGLVECVDIKLGYRHQWAGFEGKPSTAFVNGHGKISLKNKRKTSFFGVGARIVNDGAGPFNFIQMELAAAYHVKLGRKVYGSMGLFAGIMQSRFDVSGLTLTNFNDPAINGSAVSIVYPAITPGLLIYGDKFFVGMSIQNMINMKIPDVGYETRTAIHYIFKGAKSFSMDDRQELVPSIVFRYVYNSPIAFDANLLYRLDKKYSIGVSYRNETAIAAMINIKIFNMFSIGYAYDYVLNNIKYGTSGSHEIIVGFNSCDLGGGDSVAPCAAFD